MTAQQRVSLERARSVSRQSMVRKRRGTRGGVKVVMGVEASMRAMWSRECGAGGLSAECGVAGGAGTSAGAVFAAEKEIGEQKGEGAEGNPFQVPDRFCLVVCAQPGATEDDPCGQEDLRGQEQRQ